MDVGRRPRAVRVHLRERRREALEPARARTPPAVDRLVRVAHRGDRVPAAEERAEQGQLGVGRVLVLVEQDDPEPLPLADPDLGHVEGEPRGQGHLVAEVDRVARALARPVLRDELEDPDALPQRPQQPLDLGVRLARRGARRRRRRSPR